MKHKAKSASPGELAYSIDDPPRPVSTSENNSTEGVYLTVARNTQPGACIGCGAHTSATIQLKEAKQTNQSQITEECAHPRPRSAFFPTSLFRYSRRRSADTCLAHKLARKLARKNFQKPQQNTQTGTQNTFFFFRGPKC